MSELEQAGLVADHRMPATLEVRAAEVFVAVAEELHFGRAADRRYMTQPAVSRHISRLEASLGLTLAIDLRLITNRHLSPLWP